MIDLTCHVKLHGKPCTNQASEEDGMCDRCRAIWNELRRLRLLTDS